MPSQIGKMAERVFRALFIEAYSFPDSNMYVRKQSPSLIIALKESMSGVLQ